MKKYFLILTVLALACGNKDDEVKNELVGSWVGTSFQRTNCADSGNNGEGTLECNSTTCERYIFSDSSTYVVERTDMGATLAESGTLSISGDKMTLCEQDEDGTVCTEFTFALSGSSLFLTGQEADTDCVLRTGYSKE